MDDRQVDRDPEADHREEAGDRHPPGGGDADRSVGLGVGGVDLGAQELRPSAFAAAVTPLLVHTEAGFWPSMAQMAAEM